MTNQVDIVELAREIARIAGKTTDPATGLLLMELVERLLRTVGMPPGSDQGPD
jgi:hypothetical protein